MIPRKLRVGVVRFPYGGNGSTSMESPDVADWLIGTICKAKQDERIEAILHERFSDCPVTMTRNKSVQWAKENGVDVLLMVDSDMAPDLYVGKHPTAVPFFETSFDFLYKRYEQQMSVIVSPYCGPPTHPTEGGQENVYVFRWTNFNSGHMQWPVKMEAYGRMEAALMTGITNIDTGPTGLCMIDMRIFDHLTHPYFDYEWAGEPQQCGSCHQQIPGPRTEKASTEDCFFFRNIALNCSIRLGYNPVFCNWDAWSGHWKPWCVGKPAVVTSDMVGRSLHEAVKGAPPSGVQLRQIGGGCQPEEGEVVYQQPPEPTIEELRDRVAGFQSSFTAELDDTPDEDDLGHRTPRDDLAALEKIVGEHVASIPLGNKVDVVELGAWVGKSAMAIAGAMPLGVDYLIHCVDQWAFPKGDHLWMTKPMADACMRRVEAGDQDPIFSQFRKNVEPLINRGRLHYYRNTTDDQAKQWNGDSFIDIIYIDADHSCEAVTQDLTDWVPKVKAGGLIIGDDYRAFESVREAVDKFFPNGVKTLGNLWYVTKDG